MYSLDKTKFKSYNAEEQRPNYFKTYSWTDRLRVSIYLNSIAYRLVGVENIKMNKTVFKATRENNG
jgi:hypothetical protein